MPHIHLHLIFRYFNYRTTRFLAEEGFYKFHNWFDDRAWYPLGRIIGGTIYPGKSLGGGGGDYRAVEMDECWTDIKKEMSLLHVDLLP